MNSPTAQALLAELAATANILLVSPGLGLTMFVHLLPFQCSSKAGPVEIAVPRDRDGTFEPKLVRKHQLRPASAQPQSTTCTVLPRGKAISFTRY